MATAQGTASGSERRQQADSRVVSNISASPRTSTTHAVSGDGINSSHHSSTRIGAHHPTSPPLTNTNDTDTGRSGVVSGRYTRVGSPTSTTLTRTGTSNADAVTSGAGIVSGRRNRVGSSPRITSTHAVTSNSDTVRAGSGSGIVSSRRHRSPPPPPYYSDAHWASQF